MFMVLLAVRMVADVTETRNVIPSLEFIKRLSTKLLPMVGLQIDFQLCHFGDVIKITSPKILHRNNVIFFFPFFSSST